MVQIATYKICSMRLGDGVEVGDATPLTKPAATPGSSSGGGSGGGGSGHEVSSSRLLHVSIGNRKFLRRAADISQPARHLRPPAVALRTGFISEYVSLHTPASLT